LVGVSRAPIGAVDDAVDAAVDDIVHALEARFPVPSVPLEAILRHAQFRIRLLRDYGAFRAADLADHNQSAAANRSQLAYQWRRERRIFAVTFCRERRYLKFQFDEDGQPLPVIGRVLEALHGWPEWDIAAWFVTPNDLLGRAQPVALLTTAAVDVAVAADEDARRDARRRFRPPLT